MIEDEDGTRRVDYAAVAIELELVGGDIEGAAKIADAGSPELAAKMREIGAVITKAGVILDARSRGQASESLADEIALGVKLVEELLVMTADDPERQVRIRIVAFGAGALLRRIDARTR